MDFRLRPPAEAKQRAGIVDFRLWNITLWILKKKIQLKT